MDEAAAFGLALTIAIVVSLIVIAVEIHNLRRTIREVFFPQGVTRTVRACPYCKLQMSAEATICVFCRRDSTPWEQRQGVWWRTSEAGEEYFDVDSNAWMTPTASS